MSFNVYKINFINTDNKEQEEVIHSDTKENAVKKLKLKLEYRVNEVIKVMHMSSTHEIKKAYGLQ